MKKILSILTLAASLGACSWESKDIGNSDIVEVNVNPENPTWQANGEFAGIQDLVAAKCDDCHGDVFKEGIPDTTTLQMFSKMDNLMFLSYSREVFERVFGDKSHDPHKVMPLPYGNPLSSKEKVALCRFMKEGQNDIKEALTKAAFGVNKNQNLFSWISNNKANFTLTDTNQESYAQLKEDFNDNIQPVLKSLCSNCHSKDAPADDYPEKSFLVLDFSSFETVSGMLPVTEKHFNPALVDNFRMPKPISAKYLTEGEDFIDCSKFEE